MLYLLHNSDNDLYDNHLEAENINKSAAVLAAPPPNPNTNFKDVPSPAAGAALGWCGPWSYVESLFGNTEWEQAGNNTDLWIKVLIF